MPAEIYENDEMMYVGNVPWHGLGVQLPELATAAEALEAAKLGWRVGTAPVYIEGLDGVDGEYWEIPNKQAVIREDTGEVFNVMGGLYTPLQNIDAFQFFDDVVGTGEAKYETAGSLFNGRKVWILANTGALHHVKGSDDVIKNYILLSNSHDGTEPVSMRFTPIRVVCNNTLTAATGQKTQTKFSARHTPGLKGKVIDARTAMGLSLHYFEGYMEQIDAIASKAWTQADLNLAIAELFDFKSVVTDTGEEHVLSIDEQHVSKRTAAEKVMELFETGTGSEMHPHTAYNFFQAATEYNDHYTPVQKRENALFASWFGVKGDFRQKAFDIAKATL